MATTIPPKGLSFDEIRSRIREGLKTVHPDASYISMDEIYSDSVLYSVEKYGSNLTPSSSKNYHATYSIGKDGSPTIGDPTEVKKKAVYEAVSVFAVEMPELDASEFSGSASIIKPVRLFKCGAYPDRACKEITHSDADNIIIPGCAGLKIEIEHLKQSPFSGKIGKVLSATRNGDYIDGEVEFSSWVGAAFSGETPKVSIHLDANKKPVELSMVCDPRVTEAGLMSAFSAATANEDKPEPVRKGSVMNLFSKLAETLGLKESEVKEGLASEFGNANPEQAAEITALRSEITSLKQAQSTFSAVTVATQAEAIADTLIRDGKATPAEKVGLVSLFSATLTADGGSKFSASGAVEFGAITKAAMDRENARPSIPIVQEGSSFAAIQADSNATPITPDVQDIMEFRKTGGKKKS